MTGLIVAHVTLAPGEFACDRCTDGKRTCCVEVLLRGSQLWEKLCPEHYRQLLDGLAERMGRADG